jgi:hypothetical protein
MCGCVLSLSSSTCSSESRSRSQTHPLQLWMLNGKYIEVVCSLVWGSGCGWDPLRTKEGNRRCIYCTIRACHQYVISIRLKFVRTISVPEYHTTHLVRDTLPMPAFVTRCVVWHTDAIVMRAEIKQFAVAGTALVVMYEGFDADPLWFSVRRCWLVFGHLAAEPCGGQGQNRNNGGDNHE